MNGIYGRAATGLKDATWAANSTVATIGAGGEKRSEELLNGFSLKAAVLHDLRVPIPGFKSNIDHVVVSGKRVLLIDSKVWKPGFYWTFAGVNRRGLERVDHTAKDQSYLQRALEAHLKGTGAVIERPVLAVWSSRQAASPSTWLLTVPGARIIPGPALLGLIKRFVGAAPADPAITSKLATLCVRREPAPRAAHVPAAAVPVQLADPDPFGFNAPRFAPAAEPDPFA